MSRERRFVAGVLETRAAADPAKTPTIAGYAAVFNSPATIAGYFVEVIAPGAFANAIARDDVRALFNHDENLVLGRTSAGTLKLSEDATGLRYEITPPDTSTARDLAELIARGDVNQSSFSFRATREEWDETGDLPKRTVLEVELYDVAPVTFPAYEDTLAEVGMRSLAEARKAAAPPPAPANRNTLLKRRIEIDLRARGHSPARR